MVDQKHKTLRSFYCEDALWEMFEVMTRDLDCSMDYLINESMRHYARSRNYSLTGMSRLRQPEPAYPSPYGQAPPARHDPLPPERPDSRTIPLPAYDPSRQPPPARSEWDDRDYGNPYRPPSNPRLPPPPPREVPPPPRAAPRRREPLRQPPAPPIAPPRAAPRRGPSGPMRGLGERQPVFMFFNGQRYIIEKDRYIIGRGSQSTDLTIRDGNISRKHAAIIYHDGAYYIQDLGSTNGVEYKNAKVASKQIEEGDVFNICDYELRFSYVG